MAKYALSQEEIFTKKFYKLGSNQNEILCKQNNQIQIYPLGLKDLKIRKKFQKNYL